MTDTLEETIKLIDRYRAILVMMQDPRYKLIVEKYKIGDVSAVNISKIHITLSKLGKQFYYLEKMIESTKGLK